ncbi:MAG: hypothetical protein HOP08_16255 [Cyclobacteriaceae bacterium]|nr:hypothetical protein [Cyclobacteriaceae bacterium]
MNIKSLLSAFLLITLSSAAFGQKIKYKDLFVLLNAKQYDQAEPFLKKFVKENPEHLNASLYLGIVYQEKAAKMDMLKETKALVTNLDSAVFYFDRVNKGMTEKELSRNEEYYEIYSRRNFRTGKFDITLSDAKLDLETRLKLKERGAMIVAMKYQLTSASNAYYHAQKRFTDIQKSYPSRKELLLRADEKLVTDLGHIAQAYDSCHMSFNDYKATAQALDKTGYNQDLDPQNIVDFKKDGDSPADFYKDDLKIWDFKRWSLESLEFIEKEMTPMKDNLVAMDGEINALQQKLKKDSTSVKKDLVAIRQKIAFPELKKIDPQPMPLKVFEMKISELEYGSQIVEDRSIKDSMRVSLHIDAVKRQLQLAKKMDSVSALLQSANLEEESENYKHFVTKAYGTPAVLASLIKTTKDYAIREVVKQENDLKKRTESLRWIINGTDSIPLFMEVPLTSRFKPMVVQEEKFTVGLQYADSLGAGYFYPILPSRKAPLKSTYLVDKQAFKRRNVPFAKAYAAQDEKGLVTFIIHYSETKIKEKYPATIVKIYKQEGLAWSVNYGFDQIPAGLFFSPETFELSVKTKSSLGEIFTTVFDKSGKVIK